MSGWWGPFTATESLVETNEPGRKQAKAPGNEHFKANSHFSPFYFPPIHSAFTIQRSLADSRSSCILTCCDWLTRILKTENRYNFSHQVMGRQDQYSHCWLSFCNLYSIGSDRSLSHNCPHFQIKLFSFLLYMPMTFGMSLSWATWPVEICELKGTKRRFISLLHLLSMSPSFYFSLLSHKHVERVGPRCISI